MRTAVARRRTFAIISHPDAGKTTLSEKFLLSRAQRRCCDGSGHCTPRYPPRSDGYGTEVDALLAAGEAEWLRVVGQPDPDAWAAAGERWDALTMPYPYAYTRWQEARVRTPDRRRAVAEELGAHPLRSAILGVGGPGISRPESTSVLLTDRERQVAELLTQGCTNRQIGEARRSRARRASTYRGSCASSACRPADR